MNDETRDPQFQADCTRCAALCCMALAFDKSDEFAIDKPALQPCPNLAETGHACAIHPQLKEAGFGGCIAYDCHGAGQYVTQTLFGGRSWRDDPALKAPMTEAFMAMTEVQELRSMIAAAARLKLPPAAHPPLLALWEALSPEQGWTAPALTAFRRGGGAGKARAALSSLRPLLEQGE